MRYLSVFAHLGELNSYSILVRFVTSLGFVKGHRLVMRDALVDISKFDRIDFCNCPSLISIIRGYTVPAGTKEVMLPSRPTVPSFTCS